MSPRVSSSLLANHVGGMRHEERRWGKEARMSKLRIEKRGRASTTSMDPERTIKTGAHTRTTSGTLTEGWEITEWRWQHFCHNELVNHNIGLSLCDKEYTISELKNQIFHLLGKVCDKGSRSTGLGPVTSLQNSRKQRTGSRILPSTMSGALPCLDTPPAQSDLVVKDAADRSSRNLQDTWGRDRKSKQTLRRPCRPRSPFTSTCILLS